MENMFYILLLNLVFMGVKCELAPLSFIPEDLLHYFHPETLLESRLYPGEVETRQRREVEETSSLEPNIFTVSHTHLDEASKLVQTKCMMVQTKIKIEIRYRLRPTGVGKRIYTMPDIPDKVNGTCALETETATMFIFWPGFNLSLVFTKNPEGNSYYMNRAVVLLDKNNPAIKKDFSNALRGGKVKLETIPDKNFFWTPLGKSYSCTEAEDQGPLMLFNVVDDEIEGTIEFSETRFQPFMKRAGGIWGDRVECLPRSIRDVRDTMPFICGSLVLLVSAATVGVYGIQRTWFSDSKVEYDTYGEEKMEMKQVNQPNGANGANGSNGTNGTNGTNGSDGEQAQAPATKIPQEMTSEAGGSGANPFKQKASNPFQNYGST